jgi:putative endopeptidase
VTNRDAEKTYTLMTWPAVTANAPAFPWSEWLAALQAPDGAFDEVVVRQPSFVLRAAELWAELPLEDWKAWLSVRVASACADYLSQALVDEDFDFYGRTLSGTPVLRERWKRGVSVVEGAIGEEVGKLFVERHFPPAAKERVSELVANLVEAYRQSISTLDWMSPATRERALEKLAGFRPKVGYPDKWKDYSSLVVSREDLLGNMLRAAEWDFDDDLNRIGGPVDKDEWLMTPQTVNAYYHPRMNEIVFPAAILQPPFFDADADDAANYGGIGAVIGHEIGHGFDDQGAKYDGDGNLVDWWTDADRAEFGTRTKALIAQYDDFVPRALSDGHHVNGAFTVGENIGDLGGLSIALLAYHLSLGGKAAPVIDGLTGVQRVFYGWAQVWRTKSRDAEAIRRLATDPHSPPEFRCNGVIRNIDAFYEAFDVDADDQLYLHPEQRIHIWN